MNDDWTIAPLTWLCVILACLVFWALVVVLVVVAL